MTILAPNASEFKAMLAAKKTFFADFYATWCGPCKMVAPILHEIEKELPDLVIAKVNVDELTSVAIKYGIQSIPTLIVLQNGEVVNKAIGFRSKEQILDLLK